MGHSSPYQPYTSMLNLVITQLADSAEKTKQKNKTSWEADANAPTGSAPQLPKRSLCNGPFTSSPTPGRRFVRQCRQQPCGDACTSPAPSNGFCAAVKRKLSAFWQGHQAGIPSKEHCWLKWLHCSFLDLMAVNKRHSLTWLDVARLAC